MSLELSPHALDQRIETSRAFPGFRSTGSGDKQKVQSLDWGRVMGSCLEDWGIMGTDRGEVWSGRVSE